MADDEMRSISRRWEKSTGYDSIATIERVYARTRGGAYICIWPGCSYARKNPTAIWRHVHTAHGTKSLPPEVSV